VITRQLIFAFLPIVLCLPTSARCQEGSFFKSKTIQLYTGNSPGGATDVEVRLVSKHLSRFIAGTPTIVPKYMPGAGGAVLGNFLYMSAAADGLTLAMPGRSGFLLSNVVPQPGIAYKLPQFSFIGSSGGTSITLWVRRSLGISSANELHQLQKPLAIGALAPRSQSAVLPRVLARYHNWPIKVVVGYPGNNEIYLGIERGEIDGLVTAGAVTRQDLVSNGVLVPLLQSRREIPGIPLFSEIAGGGEENALVNLLTAPSELGLPLIGPPGISESRLLQLQRAFKLMADDNEFKDDADIAAIPVGTPLAGPVIQSAIASALSDVPADVVKKYVEFLE
jgi:tripartite-type tricarboxylate transporter receptor subunit TctC